MKYDRVEPLPCTSDMDSTDRIRSLIQELWEARQRSFEVAPAANLGQLWSELEEVVVQELDHIGTEGLALQD